VFINVWTDHIIGSKILGFYKNPYDNTIVVVINKYRFISNMESDTLLDTLDFLLVI
jgi:hypothetical protein